MSVWEAAAALVGLGLLLVGLWRARHAPDPKIGELIRTPVVKYPKVSPEQYDQLRAKAQARRNQAEDIRASALRVETGDGKKKKDGSVARGGVAQTSRQESPGSPIVH